MTSQTYAFRFDPELPIDDVRDTLKLAVLAASAIHGEADVFVDATHVLDADRRICRIDGSTPAGRDLVRLFSSFLTREFGSLVFSVERIGPRRSQHQPARSA